MAAPFRQIVLKFDICRVPATRRSDRRVEWSQGLPIVGGTLGAAVFSASWLFWRGAGWVLARGVPRETALGRMIALVLAGSWIEFIVALPV